MEEEWRPGRSRLGSAYYWIGGLLVALGLLGGAFQFARGEPGFFAGPLLAAMGVVLVLFGSWQARVVRSSTIRVTTTGLEFGIASLRRQRRMAVAWSEIEAFAVAFHAGTRAPLDGVNDDTGNFSLLHLVLAGREERVAVALEGHSHRVRRALLGHLRAHKARQVPFY